MLPSALGSSGDPAPSSAYDGVEALERFSSEAELHAYRRMLLAKSAAELEFIRRHMSAGPRHAFELGTGNGRLLIALALAGEIESGVGIDLSASRITFAQRWAADLALDGLRFVAADALDPSVWPTGPAFDLVLCVSSLLGAVGSVRDDAEASVARRMCQSLRPGGCAIAETYQLPAWRQEVLRLSDNRLRVWMPLPAEDRFAYYLSEFAYDPQRRVMRHEKTFVGRDGSLDVGRVEFHAYRSRNEIEQWMREGGAAEVLAFSGFAGDRFDEPTSDQLVVVAGAPGWRPSPTQASRTTEIVARRDGPGAWV